MKHVRFISVTVFILLTRGYDLWATHRFTPDLKKETNVLVTVGGLHWDAILVVMSVLMLLVIALWAYTVYGKFYCLPAEKDLSFRQFVSFVYLGRLSSIFAFLFKLPSEPRRFAKVMGSILAIGFAWAGVVSTLMWLLILHTTWYYPMYHFPPLIMLIILGGIFGFVNLYFRNLYAMFTRT